MNRKTLRAIRREMIGKIPEDTPEERWREVPGFGGIYAASTLGRVYSICRPIPWVNGSTKLIGGDFLRRSRHTGQYHLSVNGDHTMMQPATAILTTFVREGKDSEVAVVIDKEQGPRLGNVEWRDNADFCVQKFERTYGAAAKITAAQVHEILRRDLSSHANVRAVAGEFGLSVSHVYRLRRGENQITLDRR